MSIGTHIVAVSGWRGSGKDTVAAHLVKHYGYEQLSFAAPLKDQAAVMFDIPREWMDDRTKKESPLFQFPVEPKDGFTINISKFMLKEFAEHENKLYWTPRALCILIGSTARSVDPNHWVKKAVERCKPGRRYVISDVRYQNEVNTLKGLQLKSDFPKTVASVRVNRFEVCSSEDPSERDLDTYCFDYTIDNRPGEGRDLDWLYRQVDLVMGFEEIERDDSGEVIYT